MNSRIRSFYDGIFQILDEIGENREDFLIEKDNDDAFSNKSSLQQNAEEDGLTSKRKQDLLIAMKTGDVNQLESAIEWAILDGCSRTLQTEIAEANKILKEKILYEKIEKVAKNPSQSVISEIRSYAKPPKPVHDIMLCVYLLLGDEEDQLKTWSSVQAMMNQNGKKSLKRSMDKLCFCDMQRTDVERVQQVLSCYDFQYIYDVSEGAAVFYVWLKEKLAEVEQHSSEKIMWNE